MPEQIEQYMRTLKLGGMAREWRNVEFQSTEQYVRELLELELREREVNRINRMVKTAGFQVIKTLEDFVWNQNIELPVGLTREYMEGLQFLPRKENLIFLGSVGTGKTHLATAIALKACQAGRRVRFFTAASLANLLLERNNKGTLNSFLENLRRVELIVVDEIGFVPLHKDAAELLFQVISDCYERRSLIITSNLEFSQWNTVFGDNRLTAAASSQSPLNFVSACGENYARSLAPPFPIEPAALGFDWVPLSAHPPLPYRHLLRGELPPHTVHEPPEVRYPVTRPEWPASGRFGVSAPDVCAPALPAKAGPPAR